MYKFSNGHVKWTVIIALAIVLLLVLSLCRTKFRAKIGVMFVGPKLGQNNIKNSKKNAKKKQSRLCATDRPCFFLFSKQLAEMVYIHIVTYFHCVISQQQHCTTCRLFVQSVGICLFSVFLCVTGLLRRTITLPAANNWCKKMWLKTFFPVITIGYYNYHYTTAADIELP